MVSASVAPARLETGPLVPVVRRSPLATRWLNDCCGVGKLRARYTIAKLRDFDTYARTTCTWRHAAVILLTPLPSLLTSLLPILIPLQAPTLGVFQNTGYMLHCFATFTFTALGAVLQVRAPCHISHRDISNLDALAIAVLTSCSFTLVVTLLAYLWRFPVPFVWVTGYPPYMVMFVIAHVLVLRGKLRKDGPIRESMRAFMPSFALQGLQATVYPAFSAAFEAASERGQIALTLIFPFIKFAFLQSVRKLTRYLPEDAEEVAVSSVEICAAMYQCMVMQSTASPFTTALVIGLDIFQGLASIFVFRDKRLSVPLHEVVHKACAIVRADAKHQRLTENDLRGLGTVKRLPLLSWLPTAVLRKPSAPSRRAASMAEKQVLTHALQIIQSAESILIVEYFEVSVPIVNALFLLWSSHFETAIYNPKLRPYYFDKSLLAPAIQSLAIYILLQLASVLVMHVVMWRRFRVSATVLLAYVLERHAWSLQGKLITWLSVIFQMPVMHYGVDFKLKFDFSLDQIKRS